MTSHSVNCWWVSCTRFLKNANSVCKSRWFSKRAARHLEELQILKFSDSYDFLASLFGAPCPKKEQKKFFAALLLEPRVFLFWGSIVGALDTLGPRVVWIPHSRAETGNNKKRLGPALWGLNFLGLRFSGDLAWALWGSALKH
jgi:hypothetical protein